MPLEVYYKNNIVVNVLNYNRFINPFYAIAFTGGNGKIFQQKMNLFSKLTMKENQ